ncbi:MAG: UDP-N-acetylglucosamine--N-acetylmuramyl-(pentapeptide) pyrophosphoryl-undecaprenol N-acetylglucosamine transferase [Candidatus Andersenbacteria bacterium]|nr:UDP-N-acetylglucosamine--N-acetylmuramyl-(pentapeptide) pyrophosphoryl-undecaprenol N-acetylglucosamine transferase [Candidatus Andersenbacteria bacterium]MBI3250308.1 UDP-N-acetylglucosamine--N-acetylmuramyl-(pentapeptide) pyrophosphoryl-undecaprenol N-acetylglucosamine transferase [Candidatus Andersenbacteria bacterium]
MRIVLTGGGTGGHIIPFEPIVEALRTQFMERGKSLPKWLDPETLELVFVGVVTPEVSDLFSRYSVPVRNVPSGKLRRYASGQNIIDILFRVPIGILRALIVIWQLMPDVIISKGGYGSLPIVLAAMVYRIPVLVHESDVVPGAANSLLFRFAAAITVGYAHTLQSMSRWVKKSYLTGTPARSQLRNLSATDGKRAFGIPENEFVLLVFGGSQGAQQLNEALLKILPRLIPDVAIIHVTGEEHFNSVSTVAKEILGHSPRQDLYQVHGYLKNNMLLALAAADAIVSRAGATTLSELAAARKPALLIPLANAAQDHQRKNAQLFEAAGAALVLDPTNMGMNLFEQNIRRLISHDQLRQTLIKNLAQLDAPEAARKIAGMAFNLAQGLRPSAGKK